MSRPKLGSRVRGFAISTLVPVALAFYCAKRGIDMQTVRERALGREGGWRVLLQRV